MHTLHIDLVLMIDPFACLLSKKSLNGRTTGRSNGRNKRKMKKEIVSRIHNNKSIRSKQLIVYAPLSVPCNQPFGVRALAEAYR